MALSLIAGIYKNHKSREWHYMALIGIGVKYLKKAYVISNFSQYKEQWNRTKGAMQRGEPGLDIMDMNFFEEHLLDHIKILICFENFLKGLLIRKGYVVHVLNRKAHSKFGVLTHNFTRPLKVGEYKSIERSYYDSISNNKTLRALKDQTLPLGTLLSKQYLNLYKIPNDIINVINDFRKERNKLHFRLFDISGVGDKYVENLEKLISFVNNKLVRDYNRLVRKRENEQEWEREYIEEIPL